MGVPVYAVFAPRMVLLELYHADNRRCERHEESRSHSAIPVSPVRLPHLPITSSLILRPLNRTCALYYIFLYFPLFSFGRKTTHLTPQSGTGTDWMNNLQSLPSQKHGHLFATLNPLFPPSPTRVLGHYTYSHPIFSADTVRAQFRLAELNAQSAGESAGPESGRHRAFAGAWVRYGFHEDGFASGLRAAAALPGVTLPFAIVDADVERGEPGADPMARLFDALEVMRAFAALLIGYVLLAPVRAIRTIERKMKKVD